MNPPANPPERSPSAASPPPFHATIGWHPVLCILACLGIVAIGIARLLDPTEGRPDPARPMDYIIGGCFIVMGVRGCRYLIQQLREPAPKPTRKG